MKTKTVIAAAVVFVALLFAGILFIFSQKPPQDITVRHIKNVQSSNVTTVTFEITNRSTNNYIIYTWWMEASNGSVWKTCFDLHSAPLVLDPCAHDSQISLEMTNLPTGFPLRLKMGVSKELAGLATIFQRLGLRFRGGKISLSPFDKRTEIFGVPTQIVSDEFVAPEPTNSEK